MVRERCTKIKVNGEPCRAFALPEQGVCWSHHPDNRDAVKEAQRRGGINRSTYRRAVRQWAAAGEMISMHDLPAFLRAAVVEVREGRLEPSQASAIATLAKTAIQVSADVEMEQRIAALEEVAGIAPRATVRRIV